MHFQPGLECLGEFNYVYKNRPNVALIVPIVTKYCLTGNYAENLMIKSALHFFKELYIIYNPSYINIVFSEIYIPTKHYIKHALHCNANITSSMTCFVVVMADATQTYYNIVRKRKSQQFNTIESELLSYPELSSKYSKKQKKKIAKE